MSAYKYLDASTCYVTTEDMKMIDAGLHPGPHRPHEYEAFLWVPTDELKTEEERAEYPMSPAFWALLDYALAQDCRWINLDIDGDQDLELPTHSW